MKYDGTWFRTNRWSSGRRARRRRTGISVLYPSVDPCHPLSVVGEREVAAVVDILWFGAVSTLVTAGCRALTGNLVEDIPNLRGRGRCVGVLLNELCHQLGERWLVYRLEYTQTGCSGGKGWKEEGRGPGWMRGFNSTNSATNATVAGFATAWNFYKFNWRMCYVDYWPFPSIPNAIT